MKATMQEIQEQIQTVVKVINNRMLFDAEPNSYFIIHLEEAKGALRQAQIQLRYAELAAKDGR